MVKGLGLARALPPCPAPLQRATRTTRICSSYYYDIPGALGTVISTTLSAQLPSGWFGSLRVRYLGRAPLIENGTVQADSTVLSHLTAGWSGKRYALRADILNLLNSDDRDIEYYYASRLSGEPSEGIEDRHFHTFEPRQVRLTISLNL